MIYYIIRLWYVSDMCLENLLWETFTLQRKLQ